MRHILRVHLTSPEVACVEHQALAIYNFGVFGQALHGHGLDVVANRPHQLACVYTLCIVYVYCEVCIYCIENADENIIVIGVQELTLQKMIEDNCCGCNNDYLQHSSLQHTNAVPLDTFKST